MYKKLVYEDVKKMLDNKFSESRILDYKESLHSRGERVEDEKIGFKDEEKKEISADISAFANTEGGMIIYGVKEENGVPVKIPGIKTSNIDSVISSLNNIINLDIEPHIIPQPNIYKIEISGENDRYLVVVYIKGQSITAPHRAKLGRWYEFFMRGANGKYPMAMEDLRNSFLFTEKVNNKIEHFRNERIGKIISEDITLPLYDADKAEGKGVLILHVISLISFTSKVPFYVSRNEEKIKRLMPITYYWNTNSGGKSPKYNIDGYLVMGPDRGFKRYSYAQFFKNGMVEFVYKGIGIRTDKGSSHYYIAVEKKEFNIEKSIITSIQSCINLYKELEVQPPFYIFADLIGVKEIALSNKLDISGFGFKNAPKFDRDNVKLPEVEIRNLENDVALVLKPLFDSLWNAVGAEKSPFYDENGNRK